MFVLDTNVVSELRKAPAGRCDARVLAWAQAEPAERLYLSAISLLELEMGVGLLERRDKAQGRVLRQWLERKVLTAFEGRVLPVDAAVALRAGRLHVPDPRSERDALIAATALVAGFTVVTRNGADFARMPVECLNPWE
jgi:toxin FitB